MARPRHIPPDVLAQARAGELTRRNTAKGSLQRAAADRVMYERRRALHPGATARQALGHGTRAAKGRSAAALFRAKPREAASRKRAREAVSLARRKGYSPSRAAREARTTLDNMRRWSPTAFDERGRVKAADQEIRLVDVVSGGEVYRDVAVRGSRQAAIVGSYLSALGHYLATGDEEPLSHFRGVMVRGTTKDGRRVELELETDTEILEDLGSAGELAGLTVGS
jgi:hypothetical protein